MRVAKPVPLSAEDDRRLRILSKRKRVEARVQMRARVVLLAAGGMSDKDIALKLETDRRVAARWRARFLAAGVDGLLRDATRPGRPRTARKAANVERVVRITLEQTPQGATHWSTRTLAAHLGTSASAVGRIWRAHGLKPHRVESFKLSNDPRFIEKLEDIVGLYLDPPEHALVLCCDEKTQIQALDRTQPGLPLKRGRGKTMTHDYKRNGVTTLFAALNMLTGKVLSMTEQLHRHQEWLRFLKMIDRQTPKNKQLHLVVDNYATHKHPEVKAWSRPGWPGIRAFTCTSRPPVLPGSTWSSVSFATSPTSASAAARSPACPIWRRPSTSTSQRTTPNRNRSSGPPKPATSSPK